MSKGTAFAIVCLALLIGAAAAAISYIKRTGISAREKPGAVETFAARRLRGMAIPARTKNLRNPVEASPLAVAEGRDHFADHCAVCHANNGSGKTTMGRNMYPPAPDMRAADTQNLTDGELFYIVQNGVRFTGMPGWGGADEDNWKLVLFIRRLPQLSAAELGFMKEVNGQEAEEE